jgi:uncharacterized protein (TIGR00255 family)
LAGDRAGGARRAGRHRENARGRGRGTGGRPGAQRAADSGAADVVQSYQARLKQRVEQTLSEFNVTVEPADLLREVSVFADRSDISEEIVRLRSHLQQYEAALLLPESSGRKLEFIVQEMGREVNTIGSKANDAEISRLVVDIKTALERIREQIQNVE